MLQVNQLVGFGAGSNERPGSFILNGTDEDLRAAIASSAPNRKTFSLSIWAKWTTYPTINTTDCLIDMSLNDQNYLDIYGALTSASENILCFGENANSTNINCNSPDLNLATGTWYHILVAYDTTQGTGTNRVRMYLNGVSETITFGTTPALNADLRFMVNGDALFIGQNGVGGEWMAGRLAFVQVIEGVQVAATDVGVSDGVWKHKKYTGSFGTHGFYLSGANGFTDVQRGLAFTGSNMTTAANIDFVDLPPYVTF